MKDHKGCPLIYVNAKLGCPSSKERSVAGHFSKIHLSPRHEGLGEEVRDLFEEWVGPSRREVADTPTSEVLRLDIRELFQVDWDGSDQGLWQVREGATELLKLNYLKQGGT